MSEYRRTYDLDVGTLDADGGGHVSNVAFPEYLEFARARFLRDVLGELFRDLDFVVVNLTLDYHSELFPGDDARVEVRCSDVGTTSFELEYRLWAGEEVAASATTTQVVREYGGDPVRVPDAWRERLRASEPAV